MNMDGSGDGTICVVKADELFPKPVLEKEDDTLNVRFNELPGESGLYYGRTDDGVLALSNYRLFLRKNSTGAETSVPLCLIESTQICDLFHLIANCKDASTVKCSFSTSEQCADWQRRISLSIGIPQTLESLFAFAFYAWATEQPTLNQDEKFGRLERADETKDDFEDDVKRLQFDLEGPWRITTVNKDYKLCPSYPEKLLVPACISDDNLKDVASFRACRRIPVVVWRHERNGAVIARCSQPEVGWLGWRNTKDEQLLKALSDACAFVCDTQHPKNRRNSTGSTEGSPPSPEGSQEEVQMGEPKKVLIVDARSYASAVTNRARGGGFEYAEYYPNSEIQFMNLGNIHAIRKSFHALRQLCASQPDNPNWLSQLERTMWLQNLSGLLTASMTVVRAIERCGRPVLVHCSDGWDRTPQITATAQLCLDPYYRTVEGFRVLVEREWLDFGHKFADRCGHGPDSEEVNERCPVFLQWLDCVQQILRQFPCSFEFDESYLIKLAQHTHACLFGTFLCNTVKARVENTVRDRSFSVWPFLSGPMYKNPLYVPNRERVLCPAHCVRDLRLWTEVYLGSWGGNRSSADYPPIEDPMAGQELNGGSMTKTRSYGDLMTGVNANGLARRSSDPSMTVESSMQAGPLKLSQENLMDYKMLADRDVSPDLVDNHTSSLTMIQHTTQKLQSLTQDLNQSDEELESNIKNLKRGVPTDDNTTTSSIFINGDNDSYNFKPIVPAQPTVAVAPLTSSPSPPLVQQRHHLVDEIDENTSRIVKIESYLGADVVDGQRGMLRIAKPIPVGDLASADMMESVDLSGKSPSPPPPAITLSPEHAAGGNLWHGSIENSTDTLVPLDQYSSPKRIIQLSESSGEDEGLACSNNIKDDEENNAEDDHDDDDDDEDVEDGVDKRENSISLEVASNDRHDHQEDFTVKNGNDLTSSTTTTTTITTTTTTQTGDSNGCDLISDSKDNDRESYNQENGINQCTTPKDQPDRISPASNSKLKSTNPMDESIVIQPQYQQLEINGKSSIENGTQPQHRLPQSQQQQQQQPTASHYQPQNQRRRRNSSNSKNDMSPNKPTTNGSISPSATNSRFSPPGARSLPQTPPSVPFSIPSPPAATQSCPDGLAHALSEQNLRLLQIVYDHKQREENLYNELKACRLALAGTTCHQCNSQQYGSDDPASLVDSMNENASNCSWEAVDERSTPSSGANSSQQITSSVLWVPDHAVSRCTTCQIEFWLGRRKHHCRSCGQIFCADCSEYWAPLSDGKLFQTVRLCEPCYQNVCGKMASSHQPSTSGSVIVNNHNNNNNNNNNHPISNTMNGSILAATKQHNASSALSVNQMASSSNGVAVALMTSINHAAIGCVPNTNCKHVVTSVTSTSCSASANSGSDREACKATTATN